MEQRYLWYGFIGLLLLYLILRFLTRGSRSEGGPSVEEEYHKILNDEEYKVKGRFT